MFFSNTMSLIVLGLNIGERNLKYCKIAPTMFNIRRQIFTFCLLTVFLSLNSLAYPKLLTHTFHHSHHTAETHSQPLCFWVCSAGQMEETSTPFFLPMIGLVGIVVLTTIEPVLSQFHFVRLARGPPRFLLG